MNKDDKKIPRRYFITFCHQAIGFCTNQSNTFKALTQLADHFGEELFCEKPVRGQGFSDPSKRIVRRIHVRPLTVSLLNRMLEEHERCVIFMTSDLEGCEDGYYDPVEGSTPSLGVTQFNPNILTFVDDEEEIQIINVGSSNSESSEL